MAKQNGGSGASTPTLTPPVVPPVPPTPAAPEGKPAKPAKEKLQEVFPTAEAATAEANSREKGPRRAFECEAVGGEKVFVVANNEGRAGGVAFLQLGGKVAEIGRTAKAKPVGVAGIMEAVNALPEAERAAVLAQLKDQLKS